MSLINRTEREQTVEQSFGNNSWIWLQNHQKAVFWPYFRGLNQYVSPHLILKSHIRNLHACAAEESVHISEQSFVQISVSVFLKSCFGFQKIKKF